HGAGAGPVADPQRQMLARCCRSGHGFGSARPRWQPGHRGRGRSRAAALAAGLRHGPHAVDPAPGGVLSTAGGTWQGARPRMSGPLAALIGAAALVLLLAAGLGWFLRDPERQPPAEQGAILAPADGRVLRAERVEQAAVPGFIAGP